MLSPVKVDAAERLWWARSRLPTLAGPTACGLPLTLQVSHEHIVHHQKSAGNYANSIPALDKQAGTYIGSDTRCVDEST